MLYEPPVTCEGGPCCSGGDQSGARRHTASCHACASCRRSSKEGRAEGGDAPVAARLHRVRHLPSPPRCASQHHVPLPVPTRRPACLLPSLAQEFEAHISSLLAALKGQLSLDAVAFIERMDAAWRELCAQLLNIRQVRVRPCAQP